MIRIMSKLTLSVDAEVMERAKRYASGHGVSVSSLVEVYLNSLSKPAAAEADPPVLRSLRGVAAVGNEPRYYREWRGPMPAALAARSSLRSRVPKPQLVRSAEASKCASIQPSPAPTACGLR